MNGRFVLTTVSLPKEENDWVEREAKRRNMPARDLIAEIVGEVEVRVPRGMPEDELAKHLCQLTQRAVRAARLKFVAENN